MKRVHLWRRAKCEIILRECAYLTERNGITVHFLKLKYKRKCSVWFRKFKWESFLLPSNHECCNFKLFCCWLCSHVFTVLLVLFNKAALSSYSFPSANVITLLQVYVLQLNLSQWFTWPINHDRFANHIITKELDYCF